MQFCLLVTDIKFRHHTQRISSHFSIRSIHTQFTSNMHHTHHIYRVATYNKIPCLFHDNLQCFPWCQESKHRRSPCIFNFFFFSSGCSCHLRSPLWLLIVSFQYALSPSSPSLSPTVCMSLLHTSFHLVFGLPLFLFPGIAFVITLLTTWSSSILMTCPYHFSLLSVILGTPALLSSFLGCVRSWFCLFLSLHTSTSASSSRSPQSLIPVVSWWPRFQLHIA